MPTTQSKTKLAVSDVREAKKKAAHAAAAKSGLATAVFAAIDDKNLADRQVAIKAGITPSHMSRWRNGDRNMSPATADKIMASVVKMLARPDPID